MCDMNLPMEGVPPEALSEPLAHLDSAGRGHLLIEHLREVARLARCFGERFGAGDAAHLAGLWHDLGKYGGHFQKLIREENGFTAHIEGETASERDHSTAGAIHAAHKAGFGTLGKLIAFAIAGHHAGLADDADLVERLQRESKQRLYTDSLARGARAVLDVSKPGPLSIRPSPEDARRLTEMWTRFVFSALCDADFLDTESFFDRSRSELRQPGPSLEIMEQQLSANLDRLQAAAKDTEVNRVRAEMRAACLTGASQPTGVFSLTVPTGGGKTLAALAFGLRHAMVHGLDRIVIAIPYTSIIEQSASVYREVFKDYPDAVLEHHSALDPLRETPRSRLASENWDAPVVVTTTVQLFESLFANRPAACRKLHRLARSVIILDEAQTLPPSLLLPILDGLSLLTRYFGTTVVFSTATQPAFQKGLLDPYDGQRPGFERITEIVPSSIRAFARLRRVETRWPQDTTPTPYPTIAAELANEPDVLCIVHGRKDARELCQEVDRVTGDSTTLHLSALMCPQHRSAVLGDIKARKARCEPVRVVSTQLVEAGVDLDFPVVYRALGGLDSLAQAAGRCNREGRISRGELRVFIAPTRPPRGVPQRALEVTQSLLRGPAPPDLYAPESFTRYFQRLYGNCNLDEKGIQQARSNWNFRSVAEGFRMIEDDWSAPIVVPYGKQVGELLRELEKMGPSRERLRRLQGYTIAVPRKERERWLANGTARSIGDTVVALEAPYHAAYDARFGLLLDRVGVADAASLIVDDA